MLYSFNQVDFVIFDVRSRMKRNGGVVIIFGVPIYLVFLTDEYEHDMEYFKAFLTEVMEKNIEKFFTDESFYKTKYVQDLY